MGAVRNAHDADDGEGSDGEETGGARNSARPAMSREHQNYGGSIPASRRQPPEDDDIWSKHSVFEFKRCGNWVRSVGLIRLVARSLARVVPMD